MQQNWIKRLIINQLIKLRHFQNRFVMLQFIKKNWFYIGLFALAVIYFKKELRAYVSPSPSAGQEKFTEKKEGEGQSLLGIGTGGKIVARAMPDIAPADAKAFLKRFAKVAQGEQEKFKVPASALLALAYVNSYAGTRPLATEGNNYFATPCGSLWDGDQMNVSEQCYRRYEKAWDSFRDASSQLSATRWAQAISKKGNNDWQTWVEAFAQNEYSDVPDAANEMGKVVKAYRLFELD